MIGFSASFAKTIKLLLEDLKNQDKIFQYIFSYIVNNIEEGEIFVTVDANELSKVVNVLTYNGFKVEIIDSSIYDFELQITW